MKQSELLRKQADMIDLAEKHGIDDCRELVWVSDVGDCWWHPALELKDYRYIKFALCVVKGNPVFAGDTIWFIGNGLESIKQS